MKNLSILVMILLFSSCASNLPYVDTFDVQKLEAGMSISEVQNTLGKPIKIKSENSEIIWEYKFRTMNNPRMSWQSPVKGDNPSVVGSESPLYCKFINGNLVEWGSCLSDC